MRTDDLICSDVAECLRTMGYTASDEHTGGNVWCVQVNEPSLPNAAWYFGTADAYWAGSLFDTNTGGEYSPLQIANGEVETAALSDLDEPQHIADSIAAAIREWRGRV